MTAVNIAEDKARAWGKHVVALALLLALILVEFRDSIAAALTVWQVSPTYSHCFLIVPIVGWLIWEKREVLQTMKPSVAPRALFWIAPLLALWWLGELSGVNEIRQYSVVALMQVCIIALLGFRVIREIWFPVLFLLFLVPTGEYLIIPMQHFATRFVDISLTMLGIPHYTEGTILELTNGRFEIAEACAGLRFLIATVTVGVLFAYLMYCRVYKVFLFLVASIVIPLIGNGLRCLGIILLAHFTNNRYGAGADHIIYGWGFNVVILLVLIFVGSLFRDEPSAARHQAAPRAPRTDPLSIIAAVATLAGVLISVGPAWALWRENANEPFNGAVIQEALRTAGWRDADLSDSWRPYFPQADARFLRERDNVEPVELFIGYYTRPHAGGTVIAHFNRAWDDRVWNPASPEEVNARLGSMPVKLNEYVVTSESGKRLVWVTYWAGNIVTNNPLLVRLLQAKAGLTGHEGQAVIALSTPLDASADEARNSLRLAFAGLGPVAASLRTADSGTAEDPSAN